MNTNRLIPLILTVAALSASPAQAASQFLLDFEHSWPYSTDIDNYYNGGTASDGASGTNFGVSFTNSQTAAAATMFGLSNNDGLGSLPNGNYYANAPSMLGVAYPYTFGGGAIFMNVLAGVDNSLSFFYSSPDAAIGAVKAYSGLNGTGSLLGSFDITANAGTTNIDGVDYGVYDTWNSVTFNFAGTAQSFDFSAAGAAAFDNIATVTAVPEPESYALFLAGLSMMGFVARRKNKA
jgi:PEP-CTERM motif